MLKSLANLQRYYWTQLWSTVPSILSYRQVCSELSADLANIVEEEHHILDNPITSPPTSFPTKLHRLDRLNLTAQTDIIQAKGALEEYLDTVLQMTNTMENNRRNIMERAGNLERTRYRFLSEPIFPIIYP